MRNLIYIDPPFDSGANYIRKISLRGTRGSTKIDGEHYTLGEQIQYTDIWAKDNYLQFMYDRLLLLKEILDENGFIVVHLNAERVHYIKIILDEIFGSGNFRNEIIIKRIRKSYSEKSGISSLNEGCDYLLAYSKGQESRFIPPLKYDPKEERWLGYLIKIQDTTIYHAGDTDLIPEISQLKGKVSITLLPVGGNFTMNSKEAAKAAEIIQPELAIPMHYGAVAGSIADAETFVKLCQNNNINAQVLEKE